MSILNTRTYPRNKGKAWTPDQDKPDGWHNCQYCGFPVRKDLRACPLCGSRDHLNNNKGAKP